MNYDEKNHETQVQDAQIEAALQSFRASVHEWSDQEYGRARTIRRSRWDTTFQLIAKPAVGWAMAAALLAAGAGVPLAVHHEHEIALQEQLLIKQQQQAAMEAAKVQAAAAMNDDELLSHVDSDIAQAAPDAMEPLASLMNDTTVSTTTAK